MMYLAAEIPDDWRELLLAIPDYDSITTAGDCQFDADEASRAIDFIETYITHVEGALAGKPFRLEVWQQSIIANLFGWKKHSDTHGWIRRYTEVLILVARKNGKSPLVAAICLFMLFCDPMPGKQCYLAAADREQASVVFRHCKGMVNNAPALSSRCRIYGGTANAYQSRTIVREQEASFLRVISADADSKHGGNTYLAVVDELHAQPNRDLVDVLTTSMASENIPQSLIIYITSADYNRVSICNEKHDYGLKVRQGEIDDPNFLPVIFEVGMEEDWTEPDTWAKANPNLGVSVSREYLVRECNRAQSVPAFENTFRRLHVSQRTQQDVRAIPMPQWDACGGDVDPTDWREKALRRLRGQPCWGGLDLGSVSDLTAFVLLFGSHETAFDILAWFWCPEVGAEIRSRRDKVEYTQWGRTGFMSLTDGNETDYGQVRAEINDIAEQFHVQSLAVDRLFQGAQLCQNLADDGFDVVAFGQGYADMAAPTRTFLEHLAGGRLRHGNNPVLRWMAQNAATEGQNGADAVLKFSKKRSAEKIDGIVSIVMALGIAGIPTNESIYRSREPLVFN